MNYKQTQGAISIFLVIILVPMMAMSALFVDASKVELGRAVADSAGDLTLNTALTDYDTQLKELYGLLATAQDTDDLFNKLEDYYLTCIISSGVNAEDAQTYVEQIMQQLGIISESNNAADILNMDLVEFNVQKFPSGNLANPTVLKKQIVDFMKYRAPINTGLSFISSLKSFSTLSKQSELVEKKQEYYEAQQTVMEKLHAAWVDIAAYNQSAFVSDANYFTSMKTQLESYQSSYIDFGKRTIKALYKKYSPIIENKFYVKVGQITEKDYDIKTGKTDTDVIQWVIANDDSGVPLYYPYLSDHYNNPYNLDDPKLPSIEEIKSAIRSFENAKKTLQGKIAPSYSNEYYGIQFMSQTKYKGDIDPYVSAAYNFYIAYQKLENALLWMKGYDEKEVKDNEGNRITVQSIKDSEVTLDGRTLKIADWMSSSNYQNVYNSEMENMKTNCDIYNSVATSAYNEYYNQWKITSDTDISTAINRIYNVTSEYAKTLDDAIKHLTEASKLLTEAKTQLTGDVATAKTNWNNVATDDAINDTSLAKQDQAEISQLDTYLNETNIQKLITRLENIKTDLTNVLNEVKAYTFAGVFIGEIDGYVKFEQVCGEKWNNLNTVPVKTTELDNTAVSNSTSAWHNGNVQIEWVRQSMHQPDLTQDKVSMYSYLSSHFGTANPKTSDTSAPSTDTAGEDEPNGKDMFKDIKSSAEGAANDKKNNTDDGQASASSKDKNINSLSGLPSKEQNLNAGTTPFGTASTKIDKGENGERGAAGKSASALGSLFGENFLKAIASFGEGLRDRLYFSDYVMSMFSYDTIENEYKVNHNMTAPQAGDLLSLTKQDISAANNYAYGAEIEYIIYGDTNTASVVKAYGSIFAIRFGFNLVYAFSTSEIRESALAIATPISAATLGIVPVPLIQAVIIIGLACCESAMDLCDLKDGYKVPLYKSSETWHCSISGLINAAKDKVGEKAKEIIKEQGEKLIDKGVEKLNEYLDMSEEQLKGLIDDNTNDIEESVRNAYDKIITENANAAIQQLTTYVNSAVEQVRSLAGGETFESKKTELIAWVKAEMQSWASQQTGDSFAAKVKREAAQLIINNSDVMITGLFDKMVEQLRGTEAGGTITEILNGVTESENMMEQLGGEVMNYITSIRTQISRNIIRGSQEIKTYIENAVKKVKDAAGKGANELKSALNESIDGIFGSSSDAGPVVGDGGTGMASFFSFSYSDYLRLFLLIGLYANETKVICRTADVIQTNMTKCIVKKNYSLFDAAAYVTVKAKVLVKPTLLPLPLFAAVENNPASNTNWYTIEYNGISGY